jgi:carbamoyltransferase
MVILGISTFFENPAACLVVDGVLRAFCQEERFTRLKGSFGHFPTRAVSWLLSSSGLKLVDVDRIAVSWDCKKYPWRMLRHLAGVKFRLPGGTAQDPSSLARSNGNNSAFLYLLNHTPAVFEQGIRDHLRDAGHKGRIPRIVFVPHHEAHAYQAFHQSPFSEAGVLVVDGSGEEKTVSAYHFHPSGRRRCFDIEVPQSLGWFYGAFTAYLGFHANRDEGKLMGLSALGFERRGDNPWLERLDKVLRVGKDGFELDPTFLKFGGNEHHPRFTDRLRRWILSHDRRLEPVGVGELAPGEPVPRSKYLLPEYIDLAYAVQDHLEQALLAVARRLKRECGSPRLCLAGGVVMNCKANGRLLDESGFEDVFIHPASSDDGAAIGAAFYAAEAEGRLAPNPLSHVQWGPSYSDEQIERALEFAGVPYQRREDIAECTAELLASGLVCGWFQGGMEMGARALGGRSIIACPREAETRAHLNRRVKFREEWRPYCPSLTWESRDDYLVGCADAPFMILARKAAPRLLRNGPAAVHVDGTVRPQTVRAEKLPLWHALLESVGRRTGDPVLLNTSFNVRGEPIVCTPQDALRCFYSTGLDALAIGSFLLRKSSDGSRP